MKGKEAIEALKQGKCIVRMPSDPPVDLCDHFEDSPSKRGFYRMYQHDKILHLVPISAVAADVKSITDLKILESIIQYSYLNYAEYEEPS